jgi:hypothetical protein
VHVKRQLSRSLRLSWRTVACRSSVATNLLHPPDLGFCDVSRKITLKPREEFEQSPMIRFLEVLDVCLRFDRNVGRVLRVVPVGTERLIELKKIELTTPLALSQLPGEMLLF